MNLGERGSWPRVRRHGEKETGNSWKEMEFPERKEVTGSALLPRKEASEIYLLPGHGCSFSSRLGCKFDDGSMGPRGESECRIS